MKRKTKEIKRIARGNLLGNYLPLIRAFVFCSLITSLVETPFSMMTNDILLSPTNIIYYVAIILITIASVVLTVGQYCLHLSLARTGEIHLSHVFYPLKHDANRLIIAEFVVFILQMLCLSPIIGAGVIVLFSKNADLYWIALALAIIGCILTLWASVCFGLMYCVLIDQYEASVREALKSTLKLIKGHKMRFLHMQLSFFGMYFLVLLSLGIGILWVQPYVLQTTSIFYLDVKGELDEILEKRRKEEPTPEPVVLDIYA